jgi:hypothetical protein
MSERQNYACLFLSEPEIVFLAEGMPRQQRMRKEWYNAFRYLQKEHLKFLITAYIC